MRDVNGGWLIRYIHANGASFFFICLYLHIGKALYYGSYKTPRVLVWSIGVIIFILTMATAFMGYTYNNSPKSKTLLKNKNKGIIHNPNPYITFSLNKPTLGVFNKWSPANSGGLSYVPLGHKLQIRNLNTINKEKDITDPKLIFKEIGIKPNIWWEDLDKGLILENIKLELKGKSGIYIIINKITLNYYIGSAKINNLNTRFRNHLILKNNRGSKLVRKALNKYGLNNFIFGILEYYNKPTNDLNNYYELLAIETTYISLLMPQYNILTEAGKFLGKDFEEFSLNNKNTNLPIITLKEERFNLLKELYIKKKEANDLKFRENLRKIAFNRPPDYWSPEGLLNISKGSRKVVYIESINDNLNINIKFKSIEQASHYLCCSTKTIQRSLKLGWIYIPDLFKSLLNNEHINNYNSFIEYIDEEEYLNFNHSNKKNLINNPKKKFKIKSGLSNYKYFTKYNIRFEYARITEDIAPR